MIGIDLSEAQLAAAARAMGAARYPLVQGAAEQLPFAADSFDVVFCDYGGLSWAPPRLAVPQAARVLRRGGRLVFNVASPWFEACYDEETSRATTTLQQDYFGLDTIDEDEGAVSYQLTYGDWIRVLRGAGLVIDDLIEPRPGPGTANGYNRTDPPDWAHRWPHGNALGDPQAVSTAAPCARRTGAHGRMPCRPLGRQGIRPLPGAGEIRMPNTRLSERACPTPPTYSRGSRTWCSPPPSACRSTRRRARSSRSVRRSRPG